MVSVFVNSAAPLSAAHFEALLPPGQRWFTTSEAAEVLGCSDQYVRNCLQDQRIMGHRIRARTRGPQASQRQAYRIHRDAILIYLMETATYEPRDFIDRLAEILQHRSAAERRQLLEKLGNVAVSRR